MAYTLKPFYQHWKCQIGTSNVRIQVEKPVKLVNDLNGFKKKNKLDQPELIPELVASWWQ